MKHEGKRIAVEQRWLNQRTGYVRRVPFGSIAYPRMWDETANVEQHMTIVGETGRGTLPRWYVERRLECGVWVTCKAYRLRSRVEGFNVVRGQPHLRLVERQAATGAYEPIVEAVPAGTSPRPKGKGSKGMW